jgi:hypothetical protein
MTQLVREACLKPQFAELYPTIQPNVWLPAAKLAREVFLHVLATGSHAHLPERVLNDEHFAFRGGRPGAGETRQPLRHASPPPSDEFRLRPFER